MFIVRYLPLLVQYAVLIDGFSLKSFGYFNTVSDQENQNFAKKCTEGRMEDAGLGCACSLIGRRCNDPLSICDQSHHCICNGRDGYKAANGTVCLAYPTISATTPPTTAACPTCPACTTCPTTAPLTCPTATPTTCPTATTTTASTAPTTPACVVTNPVPPPSTCPHKDAVPQSASPAGPCQVTSPVLPTCVQVITCSPDSFQSTPVTPGVPVVFTSPNYPGDYPLNADCAAIFTAPTCYNLEIAVLEFDVEGNGDNVSPGCYDMTTIFGSTTSAKYCNNLCPMPDSTIAANMGGFVFTSDGGTVGHFKFLITAVQTAACCP